MPCLAKYGSPRFTTYAIWAGTLVMLVFAPGLVVAVREAPLGATSSVVYLGVFPTVIAYLTLGYAFARMPAANATSFLNLVQGFACLIAWAWPGEVPTPLSGAVLVNARRG